MKRLLLSLLAAWLVAAPAGAQTIPFLPTWDNHIFNAASLYGGSVRIFVDPSVSYMTFDVNGVFYGADWETKFDEAIAEWKAALSGTNLFITRVTDSADANVVVEVTDNPSPVEQFFNLAGTSVTNGRYPSEIKIFKNEFINYFKAQDSLNAQMRFIQSNGTTFEVWNFITRLVAKHELGHALGLAHDGDNTGFSLRTSLPATQLGPPVMTTESFYFMRRLFAQLNNLPEIPDHNFVPSAGQRLLTADDIQISTQEGLAITLLLNAQDAQCGSLLQCIKPSYVNDGGPAHDEQ